MRITVEDLKRYRAERLGRKAEDAPGSLLAELRAIRANTELSTHRPTVSPG